MYVCIYVYIDVLNANDLKRTENKQLRCRNEILCYISHDKISIRYRVIKQKK